ncbi:SGNH/GDSL hydrolase family protein [Pontibacter qinzhouensis]|uniref:SGNH/GDSL hydrolase family protein n=1 Tax=Pontibacter qinzhouensis TaxID=2603253 RepID=A0A5C8JN21_9BACT|nr:SGNH/GDSL hydrolase family protein [Pontibacter qinzhouensis]TXK38004.1 SGNH/GDSL hydrolase family protein [Pontibacter qinzhouensis]
MTHQTSNRRSFLKKMALASATASLPHLLLAAALPAEAEAAKGLTVLFQGDSITDGNRGRNQDPNHIMGHGYAFSIASRVGADHPAKNISFFNRGISGNKITDLAKRWQEDTLNLKPDVLSILVGINDAASVVHQKEAVPVAQFENVYRELLEKTKQQNPDVLLVLCEPFILPVGPVQQNWEAWHTDVVTRQAAVKRLAADYQAVFVPFQQVFDKALAKAPARYWIWDGIHPTVAGHELMTREWMQQVGKTQRLFK